MQFVESMSGSLVFPKHCTKPFAAYTTDDKSLLGIAQIFLGPVYYPSINQLPSLARMDRIDMEAEIKVVSSTTRTLLVTGPSHILKLCPQGDK